MKKSKLLIFTLLLCGLLTSSYGQTIKVLFAYTKKAAIEIGGGPKSIHKIVKESVEQTNQALRNSNIGCQIEIIPTFVEVDHLVEYDNETMGNLLKELRPTDGTFNQVHRIRKELGGDVVCLIYSGKGGGKADLNGDMMVCSIGSFGSNYIFPHEFGHILGATHEAGMNFSFGNNFNRGRTISANGGVAIPYYSDDRTVTVGVKDINGNTVQKTIKIGDASHNNSATMRKNAPAKSSLGENLVNVSASSKATSARKVNPQTEPDPAGAKKLYELIDFNLTRSGKSVTVNFNYECTLLFAENANSASQQYLIQPFTADGKPDSYNGYYRNGFNPGKQTITKTFSGNAAYPGKEMKDGSYVELQYVTVNPDGSSKVNEVVKKLYVGNPKAGVAQNTSAAPAATGYTIENVSGDKQTYTGGGMPNAMVIKVKENATGKYLTDLRAAGFTIEATSSAPGKNDGAFNNLNNYCKNGDKACYGGYYYVASNSGESRYELVITVSLKKGNETIASTRFVQNITN